MVIRRRALQLATVGAAALAVQLAFIVPIQTASASTTTTTIGGIKYEAKNPSRPVEGADVTGYTGSGSSVTIRNSVSIGGSTYKVRHINNDVFRGTHLTSATIGNNVISIGETAFADNQLTSLSIPASVEWISEGAFTHNNLNSLTLGNSVIFIKQGAFSRNNLSQVTLPETVGEVGQGAFYQNPLVKVTFKGAVPGVISAGGPNASFDTSHSVVLHYLCEYGELSGSQYGFTAPKWKGYSTKNDCLFQDVPDGAPFHDDIEWLTDEGITTGYTDGTFRPKGKTSREAMAAYMYRMAGEPTWSPPATPEFRDVSTSDDFYKEINWLKHTGITTGYTDGTFRPKNKITREAMAAYLNRLAGKPEAYFPIGYEPYSDVARSTNEFWYEISWLEGTGITTGYPDGTFRPKNKITREATAAYLHRFHDNPDVNVDVN